jgi:hypothetical protein
MRKILGLIVAGCLVLIVASAAPAGGDAETKALLERALEAAGGEATLARLPASIVKGRTTVHTEDGPMQVIGQLFSQGATLSRNVTESEKDGKKIREVVVLNRDKGWRKVDNEATEDLEKDALRDEQEMAYAGWVASLAPLKGKNFKLSLLGESKVGDRPVVGLEVKQAGQPTIKLFFDKKDSMLLKLERRARSADTGKEVTEELLFSDYKQVQGTQQPMTIKTREDGKLVEEFRCTEIKLLEKLDDKLFQKP